MYWLQVFQYIVVPISHFSDKEVAQDFCTVNSERKHNGKGKKLKIAAELNSLTFNESTLPISQICASLCFWLLLTLKKKHTICICICDIHHWLFLYFISRVEFFLFSSRGQSSGTYSSVWYCVNVAEFSSWNTLLFSVKSWKPVRTKCSKRAYGKKESTSFVFSPPQKQAALFVLFPIKCVCYRVFLFLLPLGCSLYWLFKERWRFARWECLA